VLLTATGTVGGLLFAAWGAVDIGLSRPGARALALRGWSVLVAHLHWPRAAFGALALQLSRSIERACFDLVGHLQVGPVLLPASDAGADPAGQAPLAAAAPLHVVAEMGTSR
jgi:hypothetical protein